MPFDTVDRIYLNKNIPKWLPQNQHIIYVLKDGKEIPIVKDDVSSIKDLVLLSKKYGDIPVVPDKLYQYRYGEVYPIPDKISMDPEGLIMVFKNELLNLKWKDIRWIKKHLAIVGGITFNMNDGSKIKVGAFHQNYKRHRQILKSLNVSLRKSRNQKP